MPTTVSARGSVVVDEILKARATEAVIAAGDEQVTGLTLTTSTGRVVDLGPALSELVSHVLMRVAQGGEVTVSTVPELLTTSAAADMLGVSRPTVMKLIRSGELTPVMAGTHHRLKLEEVTDLRAGRELARREAIEELLDLPGEDE